MTIKGKDFIMYYDTSCLGLGIVLMRDQNLLLYSLMPYEKMYPTHVLEVVAMVFELMTWRHSRCRVKYEVLTIHHTL